MIARMFLLVLLIPIVSAQRCELFPKIPLGMTDKYSGIPDERILASSELNAQSKARYGRLHHADGFLFFRKREGAGAWIAGDQNINQWLQIDLGSRHVITGIATQGRKGGREWVADYYVQYSDDLQARNWLFYRDEYGSPYLFEGNVDDLGVVENVFMFPIVTRYLRINPQRWNNLISLRAELYGCKLESHIASFAGSGRIEMDVMQGLQTVNDTIQFRFRTQESNGLVLYAHSDQGDYLSIELYQSKLRIGINLGSTPQQSGINEVFAGSLLDDNMWHDVLIVRDQRMFNVSVDRVKVWLELQTEYVHLNLNDRLFLGGLDVFTNKPGLIARQNFSGCLENVWINGLNMIRDSRMRSNQDNGISGFRTIGAVGSDCALTSASSDEIITFGSEDAFIRVTHSAGNQLQFGVRFRTFQKDTSLVYHPLELTDGFSRKFLALDIIESGKLQLVLQTGSKDINDISVSYDNLDPSANLNQFADGQWHTVELQMQENLIRVSIDGYSYNTMQQMRLITRGETYIGASPNRIGADRKSWRSFRGCIKQMTVQSRQVIYNELPAAAIGGLILNGTCAMRDRCMPNPCRRNANCTQDWSNFYCSCPPGYADSAVCHQSTLFTSCSELRLLYPTVSEKNVTIDIDSSQILDPVNVQCIFSGNEVRTLVNHTSKPETVVNGYNEPGSFIFNVDYQTSMMTLGELVRRSVRCRQSISYKCRNARLLSRPTQGGTTISNRAYTWWVSRRGQPRFYWGGSAPGHQRCACGLTGTCQLGRECNCDMFSESQTSDQFQQDNGYFNYKQDLPVSQLRFGDTGTAADNKEGRFTLGSLECFGDKLFDNTITFRKADATIELEAIYSETELDIRFLFKTTQEDAVFFQNNGNRTGHSIEARLKRGREIQFSFNAGYGVRSISSIKVNRAPGETAVTTIYNNNEWHIVRFERNRKEFTLQIDEEEIRRDTEPEDQAFHFLKFDTNLFVGATQNFNEGYLGCLSNLMINGVVQDIRGLVERGEITYGVGAGCQPRCANSPCLYRGECQEFYSHYYCECGMTPFRGYVCGREVGATFPSEADQISIDISQLSSSKGINTIDEYMQIGFKTRAKQGLLMQVRSPYTESSDPEGGPKESIGVRLNNAGGITVDINVGFEWHEVTTKGLDVDLTNDQHHTVIVYRTKSGKQVNIKVDDYPVQYRDFSDIIADNQDTRLDNPSLIMIGRNQTMAKGFQGCIYRVQFNNFFPLKAAFQEPNNSRVTKSSGIREDYCGFEEIMPIPDSVEIRPYATIPPNITFERPEDLQQRNQTIIVLAVLIGFALCLLIGVACFFRNYTFERGDYETNEAKGDDLTDDPDVALQNAEGGMPAVRGREWWL